MKNEELKWEDLTEKEKMLISRFRSDEFFRIKTQLIIIENGGKLPEDEKKK